jgi:hypothetical protein
VPSNGGPFAVIEDSCGVNVFGNTREGSEAAITPAVC